MGKSTVFCAQKVPRHLSGSVKSLDYLGWPWAGSTAEPHVDGPVNCKRGSPQNKSLTMIVIRKICTLLHFVIYKQPLDNSRVRTNSRRDFFNPIQKQPALVTVPNKLMSTIFQIF